MALPTVHFHEVAAGTDVALLSAWMSKTHELLIDADWTLEYANADAIGTGTASDPAWDKTPAANTDAGIAVYQMPLNGHDTGWFVRLRPGWAALATRPHMRGLQVGTTHDTNGVVTGGSVELAPGTATLAVNNLPWKIAASEDGFVVIIGTTTTSPAWMVERLRTLTGTVLDDVYAWNKYTSTIAGFEGRHVRAGAGEVNAFTPVALLRHDIGNIGSPLEPMNSGDATRQVLIGPYFLGGDPLFAPPRLAVLASPADVANDSSRALHVDGGNKAYKAMPGNILTAIGIWLVATE